MPIPTELANRIMSIITRDTWLSLHTANPGPTGGNELQGNAYRRQRAEMTTPAGGAVQNADVVVFPMLPASTVTHVGFWDAATDGNLVWVGQLHEARSFADRDNFFLEREAVVVGFFVMDS